MNEIRIYTTPTCGFCVAAKRLLQQRGLRYTEVDVANDLQLRRRLAEENDGYTTVPMIFIADRFVGGFQELSLLDEQGKLQELVQGA